MEEKDLRALATELAKSIKTEADLKALTKALTKLTVETALHAELTEHVGHEKNQPRAGSNARNGFSKKRLITDEGWFELDTPRDREGSFEPQLVKKHQTRLTQMDDQILFLYS